MKLSKCLDTVNTEPANIHNMPALEKFILENNYSLGRFKNNYRVKKNFLEADLIGLDFDGGFTLEQATTAFQDQWHIIATTRNHQLQKKDAPACDRFRVILKAEAPILVESDYQATVKALMNDFPQADKNCSDGSRMFYKSNKIVSCNSEGTTQPVVKYVKPETDLKLVSSYRKGNLATATLEFIAFGAPGGSWNGVLFKAAKDLQEQGYTQEEATSALTGATRSYEGSLNDEDLKTINSAYNTEPKHAPRGVESMFNFKHPSEISESAKIEWFADGVLAKGAVSILAGAPKSGKSTLTRQLAIATAMGGEWLGRTVEQTPVLYLALEEQEGMLKAQLTHLGLQDEHKIFLHSGRPDPGNTKEQLIESINHFNAGLVIIDTMLLLSNFTDINNYNEAYAQISPFREVARETGAHLLLIHHTNKSGTMMGSQGLLGAVDCGMTLSPILGDPKRRKLDSLQRGGRPFTDFVLEYNNENDMYFKSSKQTREF